MPPSDTETFDAVTLFLYLHIILLLYGYSEWITTNYSPLFVSTYLRHNKPKLQQLWNLIENMRKDIGYLLSLKKKIKGVK